MKIKMLTSLAGQFFERQVGDVYDADPAEAKRLIERGMAEPIVEIQAVREKVIERAVAAPPPERAVSVAPQKARHQQNRGDHR